MAVGVVLFTTASDDYWNKYPYETFVEVANAGKKMDQYTAVTNFGLIIVGLGLAVLAFGLASQRPSQLQFREVPSHIPLEQYPQPPQSP